MFSSISGKQQDPTVNYAMRDIDRFEIFDERDMRIISIRNSPNYSHMNPSVSLCSIRANEISDSTYRNHTYALKRFTEFCTKQDLEYINDIDDFDLADFRLTREEEVKSTTVYNNLSAVRTFIRWCEHRDLISDGLADGMTVPNRDGEVRNTKLDAERAERIKQYLQKYEYCSLRHTLFVLLWDTGIRTGTIRGVDLGDFHPEAKYIEIHEGVTEYLTWFTLTSNTVYLWSGD